MISIPEHIQTVPREASARLLEKQFRARLALRSNPFAYAMNIKLKKYFRDSAKVLSIV